MDMAAIPTQRETAGRARGHAALPGSPLAPGSARALVRAALADAPVAPRLVDDAMAVVSELVTNAVVHAGTEIYLDWCLEDGGTFLVEVGDQHPARPPRDATAGEPSCDTRLGNSVKARPRCSDHRRQSDHSNRRSDARVHIFRP